MSKRFLRRFRKATTFGSWIQCLHYFNYQLVKENNLQRWTIQDYKNYWEKYKGAI